MNDDELGLVGEVGADPIQSNSEAIADFLKSVEAQNFTQAERQFNDLIGDRLQMTLDQARVKIASQLFDDEVPEELEAEADISDEDIEEIDVSDDEIEEFMNSDDEDEEENA